MSDNLDDRFHSFDVRNGNEKVQFTIPKRYRPSIERTLIGSGAYGKVISAFDTLLQRQVAIKKMIIPSVIHYGSQAGQDQGCRHQERLNTTTAKRALREFAILPFLKHPNIVQIFSQFTPQDITNDFNHLYLVMEFMQHDLEKIIYKDKKILKHDQLSFLLYQILCGVNHLHQNGIIHRDLKPANIAVNEHFQVKILDFGLSRIYDPAHNSEMTNYVITRFYRPPELLLNYDRPYTEKVDVWSIGCIFAELIKGKLLFEGNDSADVWKSIIAILGSPSAEFMKRVGQFCRNLIISFRSNAIPLEHAIPDSCFIKATENLGQHFTAVFARRIISKMLKIDPDERYSIAEALHDPYMMSYYNEEEVNADPSMVRYDPKIDEEKLDLSDLRERIFNQVKQHSDHVTVNGNGNSTVVVNGNGNTTNSTGHA
ncbi:hypothetical protein PRIPAC_72693 [Pristionchus pacificus]|uniref:mitogen-activated protein kinase n=1 Tax=Pristionchus pacificus TaxID=54126 RepID=A0A2A6CG24_PRIPA|nr:hypothetical protein PRIPAC_72693 [Pristionchus pacificus]|eukprot:PDM77038.1 protein kinase [Pristionchus pacificus]